MCIRDSPGSPRTGDAISGLVEADATEGAYVLHAGTRRDEAGLLVSSGGRVLNVVARGADLAEARHTAYLALSNVSLAGGHHRTDIALAAARGEIHL